MVVLARRPSIFSSSFNHTYERFLISNTFQCVKTIHTVYNKDVDFDDFESFFSLPHSDSYCSNSRYMIKSSSFYPVAIRYFDTSLFYAVSYTSSPPNLRSKQSKWNWIAQSPHLTLQRYWRNKVTKAKMENGFRLEHFLQQN